MKRILMVVGTLECGGAESLVMNLFRNIDHDKFIFDFVTLSNQDGFFSEEIKKLGGKIYYFPKYKIYNGISFRRKWKNFFKEHKGEYEIIHTHHSSSVAIILKIAKKYGLYTVAHSHSAGWEKSIRGLLNRMFSKGARKVANYFLACSYPAGVTQFGKKVADDESRFKVVANGIPSDKYIYNVEIRNKIRKQLELSDDVHLYGHVGRFVQAKNHSYLLKVFSELLKKDPNSKLILLGNGELKEDIVTQAKSLGVYESLIMPGVVNTVNEYMQAMDYFIFPSSYEGLPVTLVEAQASGLKCLISKNISDDVVLTDLVESYSIDLDPREWANRILENINYSRQNTSELIKKAGFDINSSVEFLTNFYTKVLLEREKK